MIQNLRAYFIHYTIAIKLVMSAQEKNELSRMSQKSRLNFSQKLGMSLFSNVALLLLFLCSKK